MILQVTANRAYSNFNKRYFGEIKFNTIKTTRQTGGLLLAYKAKGLKPRLKSHAFTYVQAYCSLSPAGTTYYP